MLPSAAVTAAPAAGFPLDDYHTLSAPTVFATYRLYQRERLSLRAMRTHYAMRGMHEQRDIGNHPFKETRLEKLASELARRLGSNDDKRNLRALRELVAVGVWRLENGVWRPAECIGELDIDPSERRDLGGWLASLTRRKRIIVPRFLLEGLPRLNGCQIALNLELLTRCSWSGDKRETTAIVSLRIRRVAARWEFSAARVKELLSRGRICIGPYVRLTLDTTTPGWYGQKYGRRFCVTVGLPTVTPLDTPDATPDDLHKCALQKGGHKNLPPPPQKGTQKPTTLDLSLHPPLRGALDPSESPAAAEDPGACQPEEKRSEEEEVTTGEGTAALSANTVDPRPADSALEGHDVMARDLDPKPANTPDRQPIDPGPEDFCTLPTPTADPLPTDRAPEPEAETLTPGDDLDALPADTADLRPVDPEPKPEPTAETPAATAPPLPPPDRHDMIPADLGDLDRLRVIYGQDVACGCLPHCEANWLMFVTAAVHARRVPNILNRPALFRKIIKSGNRHVLGDGRVVSYLTDEDEQAALAWIKAQEPAPVDRELRLVRKPDAPPALSPDADLVVRFQEVLAFTRYDGDVFLAFKRTDEGHGWDRARFDAALAELATPPEPACLSPAVLPDWLAWGSELAQIDPPIAALGLPTPAVNTSLQKPTEAPTPQREKMEMMTSQKESIPRPAVPLPEDEPVSLRYFSDARVLSDDGHLLKLYAEAVSSGLVSDDEDGFLRFVAAAEHALNASGVPDRPLLFKTIVRGKWGLVPNAAIDRARERLHTINFKRPSHGGPDDVAS